MFRIALTGPESSGKTALAEALAGSYRSSWVPEFARHYLENLRRPYVQSDLLEIAKGQIRWEEEYAGRASGTLFCDTEMLVVKIWSEYRYGNCHPWIQEQWCNRSYDLFLLCKPDIPWQEDPLRENREERELLYDLYRKELERSHRAFVEITGTNFADRLRQAVRAIDRIEMFENKPATF